MKGPGWLNELGRWI